MQRLEPVLIEHVRVCHFKAKPDVDGHKRLGCERCGRAKHDPCHYGAPSSLNVFGSGNPRHYWQVKQRWERILRPLLEAVDLPRPMASVMVEGEATFPDRTKRDQGNHRVVIEKAMGDVLVTGGWLEGDDWERYSFGNLEQRYVKGESATRLYLFPSVR